MAMNAEISANIERRIACADNELAVIWPYGEVIAIGEPKDLERIQRAKAMGPMFSDEAIEEIAKLDLALQIKLAALIPGGRLMIVEGAGHDIHVGKPEALIGPVVEMIKEVRETDDRRGELLQRASPGRHSQKENSYFFIPFFFFSISC
jgi:hypothetical protein